ncbi:MAG: nucleotidyltransferase family protein [Runella zeae]
METVKSIQTKLKGFWKDKPIKKAYLFGSVVRQELTPTSDIDILVELDSTKTVGMIEYIKIMEALEKLLSRKVDLVATDGLSPYIKPVIDKEKRLIYEE